MSYHIRQASLAVMMVCLTAAGGPVVAAEWIYTVQRGDNPWSLTERYLAGIKYWPRIQQLNQITDPEHIPPGTRLRIPVAWLRRTDAVATVAAVNGEVRISGRGRGRAATSGMQLRAGDVVKTARDSNLTLSLPDGSRVLVHAESELHLDDLGMFENTDYYDLRMSVKAGRLENLVAPLGGGPGRFEITTPAAVTAVRGTRYRVSATSTATRTEVTEGAVGVATDGGTVDVPPGFGSVAERGSPPAPPVALLPAPDIAALPALVERVPLRFTVPALPGATAYRVQIATAADFASPLFDGRAENTRLRAGEPPDGHYFLRVRGIDAAGLEGLDAVHAFELDARPEPPLLTTPAPAAGLVDAHPAFAWGARDGIRRYHLQVARDAEFADVVVDQAQITTAGHTSAVPLATGEYFWRVAAVDATDEGPFSDVQQFRRLPEPPPLNDPALDDSTLTIRWRAGDAGDSFHFQLAADAEFAQPLVDADCTAAEISVARPAGGTYYMRVKTVGSDGFEGPYGGAQALEVPAGGKPWWLLLLLPLIGLAL